MMQYGAGPSPGQPPDSRSASAAVHERGMVTSFCMVPWGYPRGAAAVVSTPGSRTSFNGACMVPVRARPPASKIAHYEHLRFGHELDGHCGSGPYIGCATAY